MTSNRHLALMALMNEVEAPSKTYRRCVRRAAETFTDSPENLAAIERGNAALDDIEQAVRRWVANRPEPKTGEVCGRTRSITGEEYPPCARRAGHKAAYCRSADGNAYFLAVSVDQPRPAAVPSV